jgi:DNA-binding NtrC family response regulator
MNERYTVKIIFIDDDEGRRQLYLEFAVLQGWKAEAVESVYEANQRSADVYVFDVSAVCPFMWDTTHAYAPIARLIQDHPDARIVIVSGMSRNATTDIINDVEKETGNRPAYGGMGEHETLMEVLKAGV